MYIVSRCFCVKKAKAFAKAASHLCDLAKSEGFFDSDSVVTTLQTNHHRMGCFSVACR